MLKVSEAASLGFHALAVLAAENGGSRSVGDLARRLGVSEAHLAKVMQRLARAGLVRSRRGLHGGFQLGRASERISLLEIYQAIEGPLPEQTCLLGQPVCNGRCCLLGGLLAEVSQKMRAHLEQTTLDQLCRGFHPVEDDRRPAQSDTKPKIREG